MNEEFTAKKAPVEKSTMPTAYLNPSPVAAQAEDWETTNRLAKPSSGTKSDGWRMPEPVFRVSDGFCPLKPDGKTQSDEKTPHVSAAPQPKVSKEFIVRQTPPKTPFPVKARRETARLFFAALGVLAMLSFAAGFLALVYFLFFYKAIE